MEAYAGRSAMEEHVRKLVKKGEKKTDLFKLMEEHGRTRLTSGIWSRALEHGDELAEEMIERRSERSARVSPRPSTCWTSKAVIIGGGLGVRLGSSAAERIAAAMQPHLFADSRPPHVEVAALGDLGGAIGASLLRRGSGGGSATPRRA